MSRAGFQLRAALVGDFDRELEAGRRRVVYAAQSGLREIAEDLKTKLQSDVASSGLNGAAKLAKTWRSRIYPNRGENPAAVISSKAPLIVEAFERGAEVQSPRGAWLAIPNPALKFTPPRSRGSGRRSIIAAYERRYGKLRYQPTRRSNLALLVTDLRQTKSGAYRAPTAAGRAKGRFESVIVFYLVPKIRQPRLLRGETIRARLERDFAARFQSRFDVYLSQAERGPAQLGFSGSAVEVAQ